MHEKARQLPCTQVSHFLSPQQSQPSLHAAVLVVAALSLLVCYLTPHTLRKRIRLSCMVLYITRLIICLVQKHVDHGRPVTSVCLH